MIVYITKVKTKAEVILFEDFWFIVIGQLFHKFVIRVILSIK